MSVNHPSVPISKDMNRVTILPSGWKITQGRRSSACQCIFFAHMTNDSVLIVSPDLLGETNQLKQCLNR
eukprot:UN14243